MHGRPPEGALGRGALEAMADARCRNCKSRDIRQDIKDGALKCAKCGLVMQMRMVSDDKEWRTFSDSDKRSDPNRVGGFDEWGMGLGTGMETGSQMAIANNSMASAADRRWREARQLIKSFAGRIDVVERHKKFVQSAVLKIEQIRSGKPIASESSASGSAQRAPDPEKVQKHLSKLSVEFEVAACFYLVLKNLGVSAELRDVADKCGVKFKKVKMAKKKILKFGSFIFSELKQIINTTQPDAFIPEMVRKLRVRPSSAENAFEKKAIDVARLTHKTGVLMGKRPRTIAGAVILSIIEWVRKGGIKGATMEVDAKDRAARAAKVSQATLEKHRTAIELKMVPNLAREYAKTVLGGDAKQPQVIKTAVNVVQTHYGPRRGAPHPAWTAGVKEVAAAAVVVAMLSEKFEKQRAFSVPRSLKIDEDHVNVILKPLITTMMTEKRKRANQTA